MTSATERLPGTAGVEAILTGYASLPLFAVDLMAEAGMPYLSAGPSPSFAAITAKDIDADWCCYSYTADFKGCETDVLPCIEELAAAGRIDLGSRKIAMISSDNPCSRTISEGMKDSFRAAGWTVTVYGLVPFGEVGDWRAILAKVRQDPPTLVVNTNSIPGNSALFLKQFREAPTNSPAFLQYAPSVPEFVALTGAQSDGVLCNLIGGALDTPKWPRGEQILAAYEARFGMKSGTCGVGLYAMANM